MRGDVDIDKDLAVAYERALVFGFLSVPDVIRWADEQIMSLEKPSFELILLSTCPASDPNPMLTVLNSMPGHYDPGRVSHLIFQWMRTALHEGRVSPEKAIGALDVMALDDIYADVETYREMIDFDTLYGLDTEYLRSQVYDFLDRKLAQ